MLAPPVGVAASGWWPNDPEFAPAEAPGEDVCRRVGVTGEQHYLYSFMPRCAPNARDPENASGMSVDAAWARFTRGTPDVLIAYVEGGINWHAGDVRDLVNKIWLNVGELPRPRDARGVEGPYDLNGDGVVTSADYAADARARDANGNGLLDAEDLIVAFSDGRDDDANGFVDDVSGWDFYDHQNDPATVDATYGHANSMMRQAAAETDNGRMGAGICPRCMLLPVKAGAEALDRTDDLAQAWLYAARLGADVIVSVTADLGYSSFARDVVDRVTRAGVVLVEASNDFDSTDHQGGAFWPHVLPGNGLVPNSQGVPDAAVANAMTTTFRARSDLTSWGTHHVFSVATRGGSTSESTPTVGGVVALVLSYGVEAARAGLIDRPLSGPEAVQVLIATASDVDDPSLPWPGKPGWDLQYGYGRPNVLRAMEEISRGNVPPVPRIDAPDWYEFRDPSVAPRVEVVARVEAPRSPSFSWSLEWAAGAEPADADWRLAAGGASTAPVEGPLGTIDLGDLPKDFWNAPHRTSATKTLETTESFTVTIRLSVVDADGRAGVDRRSVVAHRDPAWFPGFPMRIGPSAEGQPALADLAGLDRDAIVLGDADGLVHAIDAVTRRELPGWPAFTDAVVPDGPLDGVDARREPVLAPVSVGDLDRDGSLEVVASTTPGKVYVFDASGARRPGWPVAVDRHAVTPPMPRPALAFTRLPHAGATASPVLVDLDRDGRLDVVQASWDGHVYAFRDDGRDLPGWPIDVRLPSDHAVPEGRVLLRDAKVIATPAVADLDGDGAPEIVVQSQYLSMLGGGIQPTPVMHVFAYGADGSPVPGWPVEITGLVAYYGSAQEFITEGSTSPVAADVDGDGRDEVAVSAVFSPTTLLGGDGRVRAVYGAGANPLAEPLAGNLASIDWARGNPPADQPVTFTTTGAFGKLGGALAYAQPGSGGASIAAALMFPGTGGAIKNYERAFDAATGAPRPGFPALLQGLNFLGAPVIADLTGDALADLADGGDSSTIHAWTAAGTPVDGFPKLTTGWTTFSPAVGDVDGDGRADLVATTREGYLFAWRTAGDAAAREWWTYHHDERRTGRYGEDVDAPAAVLVARAASGALALVAPGGDVEGYLLRTAGGAWTVPAIAAAGAIERIPLPPGLREVVVQPLDAAGNAGPPAVVAVDLSGTLAGLAPAIAATGLVVARWRVRRPAA